MLTELCWEMLWWECQQKGVSLKSCEGVPRTRYQSMSETRSEKRTEHGNRKAGTLEKGGESFFSMFCINHSINPSRLMLKSAFRMEWFITMPHHDQTCQSAPKKKKKKFLLFFLKRDAKVTLLSFKTWRGMIPFQIPPSHICAFWWWPNGHPGYKWVGASYPLEPCLEEAARFLNTGDPKISACTWAQLAKSNIFFIFYFCR